ncbi:MAG: endonuclease/exonuclease/phosphatase family protein [Solirubrobacterales bacterium]
MQFGAITWNLFSGRDFPPDRSLYTRRSLLLGTEERGDTHLQVNRDLLDEFASVLSANRWDVALLQECPPRWASSLAAACGAEMHRSLTARNWLAPVRSAIARRNPDLMGSWGGGSNLTLVRPGVLGPISERREAMLRRWPERRKAALTSIEPGIWVANLHSSGRLDRAGPDLRRAVEATLRLAGDGPILVGGDLNLRPGQTDLYDELAERLRLAAPTSPGSLDHLLVRGLEAIQPSRTWAPSEREIPFDGLAIRLSDHAPVDARFDLPAPDAPAN